MTTNPLSQRRYSVSAVLADVGWITDEERRAVTDIIDGSAHHTSDLKELHLHWEVTADTLYVANDNARITLVDATYATGVYSPRVCQLDIREITTP